MDGRSGLVGIISFPMSHELVVLTGLLAQCARL